MKTKAESTTKVTTLGNSFLKTGSRKIFLKTITNNIVNKNDNRPVFKRSTKVIGT